VLQRHCPLSGDRIHTQLPLQPFVLSRSGAGFFRPLLQTLHRQESVARTVLPLLPMASWLVGGPCVTSFAGKDQGACLGKRDLIEGLIHLSFALSRR
jgi:hypothetical protein